MILLTTITVRNERTGRDELVPDRAWDSETGKVTVVPCEPISSLGATHLPQVGMWCLLGTRQDGTKETVGDALRALDHIWV